MSTMSSPMNKNLLGYCNKWTHLALLANNQVPYSKTLELRHELQTFQQFPMEVIIYSRQFPTWEVFHFGWDSRDQFFYLLWVLQHWGICFWGCQALYARKASNSNNRYENVMATYYRNEKGHISLCTKYLLKWNPSKWKMLEKVVLILVSTYLAPDLISTAFIVTS